MAGGLAQYVVGRINEVNQRRARLVLGWVTVCRWVNHLGM